MTHPLYPVYLRLEGRSCLVVGGGTVAERKAETLLECGAVITVVSPEATESIEKWAREGKITWRKRPFAPSDVDGALLVVGSTNVEAVNQAVADACFAQNILCNIVDVPPQCNFYVPSLVRRGDFSISISTNGKSPLLARRIRERLEGDFGKEYEIFTDLLGNLRQIVMERYPDDESTRRRIFQSLVDSDLLELIRQGEDEKVKERVNQCLSSVWA